MALTNAPSSLSPTARKAFTAAGHRRATHLCNEPPGGLALPGNEAFGIQHMHPGRFSGFVGGFPIVHQDQVARNELACVLHDWFARHNAAERDAFARPVSGRGQVSPLRRGRSDAETYASTAGERRAAAPTASRRRPPRSQPLG